MVNKEFFNALDALIETKNIDREYVVEALEQAMTAAYKRNFGQAKKAQVVLDAAKKTIKIYSYITVVEQVEDEDKEISLEEAQSIKADYNVGDIIRQEEDFASFNRIASQTAKQIIMQRIKEVEKKELLNDLAEKEGTLTTAMVTRMDGDNVYVEIGGTVLEGLLTEQDMLPTDRFTVGEKIKVYIRYIKDEFTTGVVPVTRTNVGFVKKLFELEIPEIQSGEVTIFNVVRESGKRTKIAVHSEDDMIDPVGACIGTKGMRINNILNEMNGEKIDIVPYSEDVEEFISAALSPATVISMTLDADARVATVIVPDDKFSLAIGRGGQNVRLAAKLTSWKIDVKPEDIKSAREQGLITRSNIIVDDSDEDIFMEIDD